MNKITTVDEAMIMFDMLGIKNVSTRRQKKNGTQVYELPIQQMYQSLIPKPLRFACYKSGYVRNISEYNSSPYQINKTVTYPPSHTHYYEHKERILIPNYDERIVYLANFILKNYYQKPTYLINDYVIECLKEQRKINNDAREWGDFVNPESTPVDDIKVIINGHRYNLS
jgi:hypothetical protein